MMRLLWLALILLFAPVAARELEFRLRGDNSVLMSSIDGMGRHAFTF
jgi:hypothetical protein